MERIPPHNDEAEKSVLGAIFLDKEVLFDILEFLKPEDFYSEMHQEIYQAVTELYRRNEPVDILTVSEELKKRKTLEMVGGRAYIAMLSSIVPTTKNAVQYGKIVAEKAVLRRLISAAAEITENSYQEKTDSEQILDEAEKKIFEIAQTRQSKDYEMLKDVLWYNIQQIDAASQIPMN